MKRTHTTDSVESIRTMYPYINELELHRIQSRYERIRGLLLLLDAKIQKCDPRDCEAYNTLGEQFFKLIETYYDEIFEILGENNPNDIEQLGERRSRIVDFITRVFPRSQAS